MTAPISPGELPITSHRNLGQLAYILTLSWELIPRVFLREVIGRYWLRRRDGSRSFNNPNDLVRMELFVRLGNPPEDFCERTGRLHAISRQLG
jgi:hypothetical protein